MKRRTIDEILKDLRTLAEPLKVNAVNYNGVGYTIRTQNKTFYADTSKGIEKEVKNALKELEK